MEPNLGIAVKLAEERRRYARKLPILVPKDVETLRREVCKLQGENAVLKARNQQLTSHNESLLFAIAHMHTPLEVSECRRDCSIKEMMHLFCRTLREEGFTFDGGRPLDMLDLQHHARDEMRAKPRHVCMWLCRKVCGRMSTTLIGKAFNRDHTTIIHGCERAPQRMREEPILRNVANRILAMYGHPPFTLEA